MSFFPFSTARKLPQHVAATSCHAVSMMVMESRLTFASTIRALLNQVPSELNYKRLSLEGLGPLLQCSDCMT